MSNGIQFKYILRFYIFSTKLHLTKLHHNTLHTPLKFFTVVTLFPIHIRTVLHLYLEDRLYTNLHSTILVYNAHCNQLHRTTVPSLRPLGWGGLWKSQRSQTHQILPIDILFIPVLLLLLILFKLSLYIFFLTLVQNYGMI